MLTRHQDALAFDGVEREPNGPPTAFRIWKQGSNVTDHGPTVFSDRSATLLLAEQVKRGNRYSIDIDHMSLNKDAPLENHAAVGWFSLSVRDGDLWATDIEWVNDSIRAGLTRGAWKYMSPAYDVDEDGEVVSFLNLSLTANPATHATTALASRGAPTKEPRKMANAKAAGMKWGDIKAALDGDDEEAKASAYAAIRDAFPDEAPEKKEEPAKDAEDEPKKEDVKAASDEPEKKDAEDEPAKADTKASVVAAQDARIRALEAANAAFQKERDDNERRSLIASREMSADLAKTLAKKSLADVRDICAALPPKAAARPVSTETIQATRGGSHQDARGSRLSPEERKALDERMGIARKTDAIRWEGTKRVFPVIPVNATPASKESK